MRKFNVTFKARDIGCLNEVKHTDPPVEIAADRFEITSNGDLIFYHYLDDVYVSHPSFAFAVGVWGSVDEVTGDMGMHE